MHVRFPKQMSLLHTGGTEQIIPTKKFEDGGTSIFACWQGRYWCLPYPALNLDWWVVCDLTSIFLICRDLGWSIINATSCNNNEIMGQDPKCKYMYYNPTVKLQRINHKTWHNKEQIKEWQFDWFCRISVHARLYPGEMTEMMRHQPFLGYLMISI
jgi:hypothetical protein